jgi:oligopeptide transport system ATP-binding protein
MSSLNPVMRAGQFVETGPAERVLPEPEHVYTRELLSPVPELPGSQAGVK